MLKGANSQSPSMEKSTYCNLTSCSYRMWPCDPDLRANCIKVTFTSLLYGFLKVDNDIFNCISPGRSISTFSQHWLYQPNNIMTGVPQTSNFLPVSLKIQTINWQEILYIVPQITMWNCFFLFPDFYLGQDVFSICSVYHPIYSNQYP